MTKCVFLSLAFVMALAAPRAWAPLAWAQRPQGAESGRAGNPGFGGLGLLSQQSVQEELKLSEEQLKQVQELSQKQRAAFGDLQRMSREERQKKFEEQGKANQAAVAGILKEEQLKRFKQISLQQRGGRALGEPEVAQALNLTDEQKGRLREIQQGAQKESRAAVEAGDREKAREQLTALRKRTDEKALGVLTPEQQTKWKELTGEPFKGEIRPPAFRGNRPGRARPNDAAGARRESPEPRRGPETARADRRNDRGPADPGPGESNRTNDRSGNRPWDRIAQTLGREERPGEAPRPAGRVGHDPRTIHGHLARGDQGPRGSAQHHAAADFGHGRHKTSRLAGWRDHGKLGHGKDDQIRGDRQHAVHSGPRHGGPPREGRQFAFADRHAPQGRHHEHHLLAGRVDHHPRVSGRHAGRFAGHGHGPNPARFAGHYHRQEFAATRHRDHDFSGPRGPTGHFSTRQRQGHPNFARDPDRRFADWTPYAQHRGPHHASHRDLGRGRPSHGEFGGHGRQRYAESRHHAHGHTPRHGAGSHGDHHVADCRREEHRGDGHNREGHAREGQRGERHGPTHFASHHVEEGHSHGHHRFAGWKRQGERHRDAEQRHDGASRRHERD